jgi:hypothetical protein
LSQVPTIAPSARGASAGARGGDPRAEEHDALLAEGRPDLLQVLARHLGPGGHTGDDDRIGEAALAAIARRAGEVERGQRRRVFDPHVGEDRHAVGPEALPVTQRRVGAPLDDPLVRHVGAGVHVDADEPQVRGSSDAQRGARVVAQAIDAHRQPGRLGAAPRDQGHASELVRFDALLGEGH